ncbi:helix-turn-helix transcriptional regulator [Nocardioides zhouii]|jgi:transcriptional regulator with XRE-family HTH domain|uniref:XRE family transcriptional regulator n=1 Tax=Nocardioides zhouii TaxID=1168729 RepID=A0A4Q2SJP9_9ACTN|nr:helix-turn-helix transcriptional regulator [Nocardioides zhouii]RYC05632.1 XRE family transcriptional regulator [Nocardioides zhouii]
MWKTNEDAHEIDTLCRNLRLLREAKAMSQAELGQAAGISRNHYQLLEAGRAASGGLANPRLKTLRDLARVLGVRTGSLILAPVVHSVWRWCETSSPLTDDIQSRLLGELRDSSAAQIEGQGAAFVGTKPGSLTLGVAVQAPDGLSATVLAEPIVLRAITTAELSISLLPDVEVAVGLEGLASEGEF